jgi:hypothetical protein
MKTLVATALILGVSALPALSQGKFERNKLLDEQYERQQKEMQRQEKEYNDTMKRLRIKEDPKVKNDPWRTIRPAESGRR